jgi:hypothetical protein
MRREPCLQPSVQPAAPWRVESAEALPRARLRVAFVDGTAGEVEMEASLATDAVTGTVFEALRDADVFARVQVVLGAVQWPNGADLAPDAMYDAIRREGRSVLEAP